MIAEVDRVGENGPVVDRHAAAGGDRDLACIVAAAMDGYRGPGYGARIVEHAVGGEITRGAKGDRAGVREVARMDVQRAGCRDRAVVDDRRTKHVCNVTSADIYGALVDDAADPAHCRNGRDAADAVVRIAVDDVDRQVLTQR